jgi:acyl carrier protein
MTNLEMYAKAFIDSFDIDPAALPTCSYRSVAVWDSIGHMGLMALLEEMFGISLETEDIIDFSSFEKGKEILRKYSVEL